MVKLEHLVNRTADVYLIIMDFNSKIIDKDKDKEVLVDQAKQSKVTEAAVRGTSNWVSSA